LAFIFQVNPVRNSSGALNPAGIIIKPNPAAEQRGIISNGVNINGPILNRWAIRKKENSVQPF
jgi:hypothetical protein